jgi:glucose-1-phosphate cytidylyltransferase
METASGPSKRRFPAGSTSFRLSVRRVSKRILDTTLAAVGLLVLAVPSALVALAIKASSPGPIIFRQPRFGQDGRVFAAWKFRTMVGASASPALIGDLRDHQARTTPVGAFLRQHGIDELPQLVNILAGDMSLVGPRAHPVDMHVHGVLYEEMVPYYHRRHEVPPGITGLAQVAGYRGIVDSREHAVRRVQFDLAYIEHQTFALDLCLIVFSLWRFLCRGGTGTTQFPFHWFGIDSAARSEGLQTALPNNPCNQNDKPSNSGGSTDSCREARVKVLILAGGRGTRSYPYTDYLPKPMMPIGGKPILVRVMQIFANQGYTDFVLSVGYRKEIIADYFQNRSNGWNVDIVDTGDDADTGDRVYRCRDRLGERFFVTYADGLCDVDFHDLLSFHSSHDGLVTITNVPLRSQYGTVEIGPMGLVQGFKEKPILREHRINAGFFIMDAGVFDFWEGHSLEQEVFPALSTRNTVYSYNHEGFFKSLDTFKDQQELEKMYEDGQFNWIEWQLEPVYSAAS